MATYTKEQLVKAVSSSTSFRQVLIKLGLSPRGGNNATVKRLALKWNVDTSHFLGGSQKGRPRRLRVDLDDYLNNKRPCGSFRLKNRLLREKILQPVCSTCNNSTWLDQPIPLELDHKDDNNLNNSLDNLRLLCPNCHALTPTYRGKNQERVK